MLVRSTSESRGAQTYELPPISGYNRGTVMESRLSLSFILSGLMSPLTMMACGARERAAMSINISIVESATLCSWTGMSWKENNVAS